MKLSNRNRWRSGRGEVNLKDVLHYKTLDTISVKINCTLIAHILTLSGNGIVFPVYKGVKFHRKEQNNECYILLEALLYTGLYRLKKRICMLHHGRQNIDKGLSIFNEFVVYVRQDELQAGMLKSDQAHRWS